MEKEKLAPKKVKRGDLMAFTYFGFVQDTSNVGQTELIVEGLNGDTFRVSGDSLIENAASADQYLKTKKVNKTEAAEILVASHNRPFTVCFTKADGNKRVLKGRLLRHEPLMGRSYVEDLEIKSGHPLRQVDHRNIVYLIVDGIKYTVK
jgi:hypothetical protein